MRSVWIVWATLIDLVQWDDYYRNGPSSIWGSPLNLELVHGIKKDVEARGSSSGKPGKIVSYFIC